MKMLKIFLWSIMLSVAFFLFADNEADSIAAYSIEWKSTGSNAVIDSVFTIDVTAIPDTMMYVYEGNAGLVKQSKYQIQEFQRSDR